MSNWIKYYRNGMSKEGWNDQLSPQAKPKALKETLKKLMPFIRPHRRVGILGAILILLSSLLIFPQPLVYRFLVDDVILVKRLDLLPWAILIFGGIRVLVLGVNFFRDYYVNAFENAIILDIQTTLLDHTLRLPKAFFDKKEIGYLLSRISGDVQGLRWFFSGTIVYLFTNLIQFIGGLGFLFYLEWRLALVCVIVLPVLILNVRYFSKHMRKLSHRGMEQGAAIMKRMQETIATIPLIKAFSTENQESQRVKDALEDGRQIAMEQNVIGSVAGTMINILPDLTKAIVLIVGAILAIKGDWTLGSLLAFQSYLAYVYSPAIFISNANFSLQTSLASLERVMGLFDIVPEENLENGICVDHLKGDIQFKGVTFAYSEGEAILQDISFDVQRGEKVAIVGPSGVGKTTLVSLILSFYKPLLGEIFFDGLPISSYQLPSIRKLIGYVSQSYLLLSGTFAENLRYGQADASQEDIEKACKAAGIHDFILTTPLGYQSRIDERGVNLSEGQKQRLTIARALIKNPDILIMDEPTSALDSPVEHAIFKALEEITKNKTTFIIAHRLATIQNSDKILLLNEKKLIAIGTHASLLKESAFYQELINKEQIIIETEEES